VTGLRRWQSRLYRVGRGMAMCRSWKRVPKGLHRKACETEGRQDDSLCFVILPGTLRIDINTRLFSTRHYPRLSPSIHSIFSSNLSL
jgi:hypothetical protein